MRGDWWLVVGGADFFWNGGVGVGVGVGVVDHGKMLQVGRGLV